MKRSTRELEAELEQVRAERDAMRKQYELKVWGGPQRQSADVVERLRSFHMDGADDPLLSCMREAAAEIEQLRKVVQFWQGVDESADLVVRLRDWSVDEGENPVIRCMHEAAAEIERLRTALEGKP